MRRTWDWSDFKSWQGEFRNLLSDLVTPKLVCAFRSNPPEYVVGDDLNWLDTLISDQRDICVSSKQVLAERIVERYDAMRAYHGARPFEPAHYQKQGLVVLDGPARVTEFRTFLDTIGLSVEPDRLSEAVLRVGTDLREGRIFFEANADFLLRHCGHYMLYGSEYINAIAAQISERHRAALQRIGVPTVFVCDVPLRLISDGQIEDYAGMALQSLFMAELNDGFEHAGEHDPSGLMIRENLPPDCIVGHFHPDRLFDPYTQTWVRGTRVGATKSLHDRT